MPPWWILCGNLILPMAIDYVYFYSIEFAKLIIRYRVLDLWLRVLCGEFLDFFACLSGVIFFGSYANDYGMSPIAYSLAYNGFYIFIEGGITIAVLFVPAVSKTMKRVKSLAALPSDGGQRNYAGG